MLRTISPKELLFLLTASLLFVLTLVQGSVTAERVALGVRLLEAPGNPRQIDEFADLVGKSPAIIMWYKGWTNAKEDRFNAEEMDAVRGRGATPLITWEPWAGPDEDESAFALRTIVNGNHDAFLREWAEGATRWGKPFYLRFAHEMNGDWYPWSPRVNGNSSEEYVAAWRHVVTIFRDAGADNVLWVWSPNIIYPEAGISYQEVYPGDDYVDWLGLDGYNWGGDDWMSFREVFSDSYDAITQLSQKPLMIAETASAEAGGDKASWIVEGLLEDVPERFPRVKAVVWFNRDKETDWRVESSKESLEAFRKVAASPLYQ